MMNADPNRSNSNPVDVDDALPLRASGESSWSTRRDIVRHGMKLVFVAPVLSTFFAKDALAAGSNHSCYPVGHACGGATLEPCCNGLVCNGGTMLCE